MPSPLLHLLPRIPTMRCDHESAEWCARTNTFSRRQGPSRSQLHSLHSSAYELVVGPIFASANTVRIGPLGSLNDSRCRKIVTRADRRCAAVCPHCGCATEPGGTQARSRLRPSLYALGLGSRRQAHGLVHVLLRESEWCRKRQGKKSLASKIDQSLYKSVFCFMIPSPLS
ncbi:hypothetical protein L209DRAFT_336980 [Thermothelomyces heterothallicus CBS 203.75]